MRGPEEVSKVGIRSLRLSGPWDIAGPALDYAAQNDIQVLYTILGGGDKNGFWKNRRQNMESDEALIEAFKENVESFVRKFGPGGSYFADKPYDSPVVLVEMWNEPNFHYLIPNSGDRKKDEPQREALYARLLQAGYDTVKSVNPDLDVGGFATGGSGAGDMRFIEHVLRQNPGIEQKFDVLTTHPYVMGAAPESQKYQPWGSYSVANNLKTIRTSMEASGIGDMPIWYTEFGWQISQEHGGLMADPPKRLDLMVTPDLQAAYTVRGYLWTMRLGVERLFIMHMYDSDGFNGGFFERGTMEWRPLAHAVQNLIRLMPDPKLIGAQSDGQDNTYIYEFTADHFDPDSDKVIAVWNVVGPTEVVVDVGTTEPEVTLYDLVGNTMQTTVHEGTITIEAGPYPVLIPLQ